MGFACPPDCGRCCADLSLPQHPGDAEFSDMLRAEGIYQCADGLRRGLALTPEEAERLRGIANERGVRVTIHPRTFLLDGRRRLAVVLDWHLAHASCPFYQGHRCSVYEARPLVCRAYPVLGLGRGALAEACPEMPIPRAELRVESRARREIERAHAALDERAGEILALGRFSKGLSARDAAARVRRYRTMTPEEYLSRVPATRSTS